MEWHEKPVDPSTLTGWIVPDTPFQPACTRANLTYNRGTSCLDIHDTRDELSGDTCRRGATPNDGLYANDPRRNQA
eukprot:924681-Pyramimonas_sp.AAC.1